MKYYLYILFSQVRDRYYIGYSHDPEKRLNGHNLGATPSTRSGRPWIIVYIEEYDDKKSAIKRESELKRMKSRKYIEALIKSGQVG